MKRFIRTSAVPVIVSLFYAHYRWQCLASITGTLVEEPPRTATKSTASSGTGKNSNENMLFNNSLCNSSSARTNLTPFENYLRRHRNFSDQVDKNHSFHLANLLGVSQHDAQGILQANWTLIRQQYLAENRKNNCTAAFTDSSTIQEEDDRDVPVCRFDEATLLNLTARYGDETPIILRFLCLNTPEHYLISFSVDWKYVGVALSISIFILAMAVLKILFRTSGLVNYVPDSCLLILLGFAAGFVLKALGLNRVVINFVFFDGHANTVFFLILLPPIILESAYQMYDREFVNWFNTVMLFAVVATLLNTIIVGPLLYALNQWGAMGSIRLELSFLCCMTYASIISATDPVAVLALFSDLGVNSALYFLVFGEALFNDGIAAVMFNTFHLLMFEQGQITVVHIVVALAKFFMSAFGAVAIGFLCGMLTSLLVKFTEHCRVVEPLLFFVLAYVSYLLSNLLYFSGIIGIIVCGVTQWHYAARNVSVKTRTTVKYFSRTLASLADSAVFVGFGLLIIEEFVWHTGFVIWTLVLIFIARFAIVYALSAVANSRYIWPMSPRKITYGEQFITAYGGLRGALAFGLSVQLNPRILGGLTYYRKNNFGFDTNYELLVSTTMVVVLFTMFVQGITLKPIIFGFLNVRQIFAATSPSVAAEAESVAEIDENGSVVDEIIVGRDACDVQPAKTKSKFLKRLQAIDRRYIKPWILKKHCYPPIRHPSIPKQLNRAISHAPTTTQLSAGEENGRVRFNSANADASSVTWAVDMLSSASPAPSASINTNRPKFFISRTQHRPLERMFSVLRDDVSDDETEDDETTAARQVEEDARRRHQDAFNENVLRRRRRNAPLHSNFARLPFTSTRASGSSNISLNLAHQNMEQLNMRKISQQTILSNDSSSSYARSRHQRIEPPSAVGAGSSNQTSSADAAREQLEIGTTLSDTVVHFT